MIPETSPANSEKYVSIMQYFTVASMDNMNTSLQKISKLEEWIENTNSIIVVQNQENLFAYVDISMPLAVYHLCDFNLPSKYLRHPRN